MVLLVAQMRSEFPCISEGIFNQTKNVLVMFRVLDTFIGYQLEGYFDLEE